MKNQIIRSELTSELKLNHGTGAKTADSRWNWLYKSAELLPWS